MIEMVPYAGTEGTDGRATVRVSGLSLPFW